MAVSFASELESEISSVFQAWRHSIYVSFDYGEQKGWIPKYYHRSRKINCSRMGVRCSIHFDANV